MCYDNFKSGTYQLFDGVLNNLVKKIIWHPVAAAIQLLCRHIRSSLFMA